MTADSIPPSVKSSPALSRIADAAYAPKVAGGASRARMTNVTNEIACEVSRPSAARLPPRTTRWRSPGMASGVSGGEVMALPRPRQASGDRRCGLRRQHPACHAERDPRQGCHEWKEAGIERQRAHDVDTGGPDTAAYDPRGDLAAPRRCDRAPGDHEPRQHDERDPDQAQLREDGQE